MADTPNTPVTDQVLTSYEQLANNIGNASTAQDSLRLITDGVSLAFNKFSDIMVSAGTDLQHIGSLTGEQANRFTAMSTAIIGTRSAFENFANTLSNTNSITTFGGEFEKLTTILSNPASAAFGQGLNVLKNTLVGMGKPGDEVNKVFSIGGNVLLGYAKSAFDAADSQLRLQHAMMTLAANTGSQKELFASIGENMEHINDVAGKQTQAMANASKATGVSGKDLEAYSAALLQIPGAMTAMTTGVNTGEGAVNILAKSMQFATGAGRDYREVTDDMKNALLSFTFNEKDTADNIDRSLTYVSKMSSIANKYGAQIEDVRRALNGSAESFKNYVTGGEASVRITDGLSEVMNQYIGGLQGVGVPVKNAISMFEQMNNQMSSMNTAQKAFLSSRSGGPGGLLGAIKIDQMLDKGDIKGVFDMVQKEIKKEMGGQIVTLQGASTEMGARQLQKEVAMLRQGPLGAMVKSDQEAYKLISSMASGKTPEKLTTSGTMGRSQFEAAGKKIEELSTTPISQFNATVDEMRLNAQSVVLTGLQQSMTARTGAEVNLTKSGEENKNLLKSFADSGLKADMTKSGMSQAMNDVGKTLNSTPGAIKAALSGASAFLNPNSITKQEIKPTTAVNERIKNAAQFTPLNEEFMPASSQVGVAATKAYTKGIVQQEPTHPMHARQAQTGPIPVTLVDGAKLNINVTSTCPHCGNTHKKSSTTQAV